MITRFGGRLCADCTSNENRITWFVPMLFVGGADPVASDWIHTVAPVTESTKPSGARPLTLNAPRFVTEVASK